MFPHEEDIPGGSLVAPRATLRPRLAGRIELEVPFSWRRCLLAVFSYSLVLSDAIRTGFAIHSLRQYNVHEPDHVVFGPFAYPVEHLTRQNATAARARPFWSYKYDTTSIVMRAMAQHLRVSAWVPCVLYHASCDERAGIPLRSLFAMIDDLVERVRDVDAAASSSSSSSAFALGRQRQQRRRHVSLRIQHAWIDRLDHFVLPWIFRRDMVRTGQAIYYSRERLADPVRTVCGAERPRPFSCDAAWINFRRLCQPRTNDLCDGVDSVWTHASRRLAWLQSVYANATLDLLVLEGSDDHTPGGFSAHGRKDQDVVLFTRVRDCDSAGTSCQTIAVDDFRFEAPAFVSSVVAWRHVVTLLRAIGQAYAWLRLAMLLVGVYAARQSEPWFQRASRWTRLVVTLRTFFLIPSQVVIYGSVVPIAAYVAAHLIDVAASYIFVYQHFDTILGVFNFRVGDALNMGAVSMRSIWILASLWHAMVFLQTQRSWSVDRGISGSPGFLMATLASLTIVAQVRSTAWRSTAISQILETAPNPVLLRWYGVRYSTARGATGRLLLGSQLDAQFLMVAALTLLAVAALSWAWRTISRRGLPVQVRLISRTFAPYSVGSLVLPNAFVVSWTGSVFSLASPRKTGGTTTPITPMTTTTGPPHAAFRAQLSNQSAAGRVVPFRRPDRAPTSDSLHVLMNLATMTDPAAFASIRFGSRQLLRVYKSLDHGSEFYHLLPHALVETGADVAIDWEQLEFRGLCYARDLRWCELLHCG
ncbi:hypothetical protein PINS_up011983 [Pythium insidiosum]|nr:hypothetical protein PINS_up011983 [Pythium insidiosum]